MKKQEKRQIKKTDKTRKGSLSNDFTSPDYDADKTKPDKDADKTEKEGSPAVPKAKK